ncbi:MAG: hypothetical protein OEM46_00565, partial [Ignavibacteria bacterium]|nr:hypothetical protein [Ignavibacteria bacterium]
MNRKLGVATSTDGVNWTKYGSNPIIDFRPTPDDEEGIFTAVGVVDGGTIYLYVGEMTKGITANTTLYTSTDGFNFTRGNIVLDHTDSSILGYGDEMYPLGIHKGSTYWFLRYTGGGSTNWGLYIARLSDPDTVFDTYDTGTDWAIGSSNPNIYDISTPY